MERYPKNAHGAAVKCIACNAPTTVTVEGRYVCVECGGSPVRRRVLGAEVED